MMRGKTRGHFLLCRKLGFPSFVFLCFFFFLAGFFASTFISQVLPITPTPERRSLQSYAQHYDMLNAGQSGDHFITSIPFQVLSWSPRILYFPNFATSEQCESIINMASPSLQRSKLALREGETYESTKDVRTSSGMFISSSEDKTGVLDSVEEQIARATMIPRIHGEDFNILRYQIGQKYSSHYDAFNPLEYGPQKSQRVASFLLYLSDVEEGGETMFPYEGGKVDPNYDFTECKGLRVKPRRGDGLLFYSLSVNGTIDSASLHGSCPVIKGEKWVATKWIRDQMQFDP